MSKIQSRLCCYLSQVNGSKAARLFFLIIFVAAVVFTSAADQANSEYEAEKKHAFALYYAHNLEDAIPVLENLSAENPQDLDVIELLSAALLAYSSAFEEGTAERNNALLRSRKLAEEAKKMGSQFIMIDLILDAVSADGEYIVSVSKDKAVDEVIKKGKAFFARNEIDQALQAYRSAEALDPTLYYAPLLIGNCYYMLKQPDDAGRAFARAIAIDPNRETAYRWWGDALMITGKMEEARAKFIEAIVAEPYKPLPWNGLRQWARLNNKQIAHFRFEIPVSVTPDGAIVVDKKALSDKDGTQNWLAFYGMMRGLWRKEIFSNAYPEEKQYRHSLPEECDAIRMMLHGVTDQISKEELKSSDVAGSIQLLMRLDSEGLLEAYILLALADEGIIQDYESYRTENRDAIRQYLDRHVIHDKE